MVHLRVSLQSFILVAVFKWVLSEYSEETKWNVKQGFIPGTKADVDTGFMTLQQAKDMCAARGDCLAITYRGAIDDVGPMHVYLKGDTTVAESDKSWTSLIKRPAGLMDVNMYNPFSFPLELCWVELSGGVAPICYGAAAPKSTKNLSSFAGHHFVSKRLVWSASIGGSGGEEALRVREELRGYEWDHPYSRPVAARRAAHADAAPRKLTVRNELAHPVEVCSGAQHHSRLVHATVPAGLESCHGIASANASLALSVAHSDATVVARQLVGVTQIVKGVMNYTLQLQPLLPDFSRTLVNAMRVGAPKPSAPAAPPPRPQPSSATSGGDMSWAATDALSCARAASDSGVANLLRALRASRATLLAAAEAALNGAALNGQLNRRLAREDAAPRRACAAAPPEHLSACASLARALGLHDEPDAAENAAAADDAGELGAGEGGAGGAESALLEVLRRSAPHLSGSEAPLRVTAVVVDTDDGDARASAAASAADTALPPLLVRAVLRIALSGVRRVQLQLLGDVQASGAAVSALHAWACAAGAELEVAAVDETDTRVQAPLVLVLPRASSEQALSSHARARLWTLTGGAARGDALVFGSLPASGCAAAAAAAVAQTAPCLRYNFVAARDEALGLVLSAAESPLESMSCSSCVRIANNFLAEGCKLSTAASTSQSSESTKDPRQMYSYWAAKMHLHELVAAWPFGYSLLERCEAARSLLGHDAEVRTLCYHYRCTADTEL
uniref:C-type lectin domain-containing protein n=1 Tax=Chrysotila carterae TaxID=13221 RepID=A0A7S4B8A8_CHRCT